MAKKPLRLDEIGYWSEIKLEIVRKYAAAYSTILSRQSFVKGHIYVDSFAGAGTHVSKDTGELVKPTATRSFCSESSLGVYTRISVEPSACWIPRR
jgi:hypothetical protein